MKRVIETKFWTFSQNNSGGYFVEDDANGVCEYVIIEDKTADDAWRKLQEIGEKVNGFWNYCPCCGERWSSWCDDGQDVPMIYGQPLDKLHAGVFRNRAFVHYYHGAIQEFKLKSK